MHSLCNAAPSALQDVLVARGMTVAELPVEFLKALEKGSSGVVAIRLPVALDMLCSYPYPVELVILVP